MDLFDKEIGENVARSMGVSFRRWRDKWGEGG